MYGCRLPMRRATVAFVAGLLEEVRRERATRAGRRSLSCFDQAVLVVRWFLDATRLAQLASDNRLGVSTAYRYLHEGLDALAAQAPQLGEALQSARDQGVAYLSLDGVVIPTDRCSSPGPNRADLWWSGKHKHHGGNIQVLTGPDGWPAFISPVRPGREHDMSAARTHGIIEPLARFRATTGIPTLADLGYEGAREVLITPIKKTAGIELTDDQKTFNKLQRGTRGQGERAHALLIMRFKALRRVSLCPWRIGTIANAALVLLNHENDRHHPATHPA
jgi:hypothetical protein